MSCTHSVDVRVEFVGRREELRRLQGVLEAGGSLTLVGPGGVGKSRLALEAVQRWEAQGGTASVFVPLAGVAPGAVAGAIATALGVQQEPGRDLAGLIAESLAERPRTLLLDNCEDAVAQIRPLAERLCRSGASVVATSRTRLDYAGEDVLAVEPFDARDGSLFFAARARAANVDVDLEGEDARAVSSIVASLDGLAIAIDLAAARLASRNVQELAVELEDPRPYHFRSSGSREQRHWTINHVVDWSVGKLGEPAQLAFALASRFAGRFGVDDVCALAANDDELPEPEAVLEQLAAHSLIVALGATGTYGMLAPIRAVARRRMARLPDRRGIEGRFAARMNALAGDFEREGAAGSAITLGRISERYDDLTSALDWALQAPDERLAQVLHVFLALVAIWCDGGRFAEGLGWCDRIVPLASKLDLHAQGRVWYGAILVAHAAGEFGRMLALGPQLITSFTIAGDRLGLARAYNALGIASLASGHLDSAETYCRTALALYEAIDHKRGLATALINLGNIAHEGRMDPATASRRFERALELLLPTGSDALIAIAYGNLADAALDVHDPAGAERYAHLALERFTGTGNAANAAWSHTTIARARLGRGDALRAARELVDALRLLAEAPQPQYLATAVQFAARVLCERRAYERAAFFALAAQRFRRERCAPAKGSVLAQSRADLDRLERYIGAGGMLPAAQRAASVELRNLGELAARALERLAET